MGNKRKVLLGCCGVPGYGGANTASYKLYQLMKDRGFDINYMNIIDEREVQYFRFIFGSRFGNPKNLEHVYTCVSKAPGGIGQRELSDLIGEINPDRLLAVGTDAAFLMKSSAPKIPLIFLTDGCVQAREVIVKDQASDAISLTDNIKQTIFAPIRLNRLEKQTVEISDLVITNSHLVESLMRYYYNYHVRKIYSDVIWFAEWTYRDALDYSDFKIPFSDRGIDLIFVARSWKGRDKNFALIRELASDLKGLNIHVVGETQKEIGNATHHGFICSRAEYFKLLGNAKTVVSPSLFDPAPGILFEASALDCNIVASRNCGNWQICDESLLVDPFMKDNFLRIIELSLNFKFQDNIDYFLAQDSFRKLVDIIDVF